MNKYMLIFHVGKHIDEEGDFGQAVNAWFENIGDKLVDGGNPFNPDREAKVEGTAVTHEPDTAAGYCIINAENLDAAVQVAQACPIAKEDQCFIKVYETMEM